MKRLMKGVGLGLFSAGVVLGAQAVRTGRRALMVEPPPEASGDFGDPGSPAIRFVVVGDSTSVGVGASSAEFTYPHLLAGHLGGRYRVRLDVVGRSGARMADAASDLAPRAAALRPDLTLVGIGANDVTHLTPLPRVARDLAKTIEILRGAGSEVLVALGPRFDAPALPQPLRNAARSRARAFNRTIAKVAARMDTEVLDLPAALGKAFARDPDLYCADRFHPSDRGYSLWADAMKGRVMAGAEQIVGRRG